MPSSRLISWSWSKSQGEISYFTAIGLSKQHETGNRQYCSALLVVSSIDYLTAADMPMPGGYPRLAALMGAHPDMTAFRRFAYLNYLNLLYLQAELTGLENGLKKQAEADATSEHPENSIYHKDWQTLKESTKTQCGRPTQWHIFLQVRDKLKEYNQAISLQHRIAKLGPPSAQDFKSLQEWMKDPTMGDIYLLGADSDTWENLDASDSDLADIEVSIQRPDGSDMHHNTVYYSYNGVIRLSMLLGTVLASLLPIGSIIILYSIRDVATRLAMIGVFTAMFSFGLGVFTNGRMVEIFSATAAFAAVQVVFVSGSDLALTP
ncbi:hypothetical protein NPX13_g10319 [Xylaria arbuscula]|uniref:DUF6594 domain-containing protein n=1 Tax=Xylaria arbuscula TaxID=114810 RepID=A0A9W8N4X9_9PEZI|nr:hypothetical protein NPX13_g10319 [Xylaria arbuscula]